MTVKRLCLFGLYALTGACRDEAMVARATARCESLLATQELASLQPALRDDPRAAIRPKGDARVSEGESVIFIRRAYDRLVPEGPSSRIEPRDYSCRYDGAASKVIALSTNGHTQEIRDNDDEWAIKQRFRMQR